MEPLNPKVNFRIADLILNTVHFQYLNFYYKDYPDKEKQIKRRQLVERQDDFGDFLQKKYPQFWHLKNPAPVISPGRNQGSRHTRPEQIKIRNYKLAFINHQRDISKASKGFLILIVLCKFLLNEPDEVSNIDQSPDFQEILAHYFLKLKDAGIVSDELYERQKKEWEEQKVENWDTFFVVYYPKQVLERPAKEEFGIAVLKIDGKWKKAKLEFYEGESGSKTISSVDSGEIKFAETDANLFVVIENEERKIPSLLALSSTENKSVKLVPRFDGCFCSVQQNDSTAPIAGRIILEKKSGADSEVLAKTGEVPDHIQAQLINQVIVHHREPKPKNYQNWVGSYSGYWFFVNENDQEIRPLRFRIDKNRTCRFTDQGTQEHFGTVHWLDPEAKVLKCSFGSKINEPSDYRLTMLFDISGQSTRAFEGVYSGERMSEPKPMAGRIKLYRSAIEYEDIVIDPIKFENVSTTLKIDGDSLLKSFWGETRSARNFLQPNLSIFRKFFDPPQDENSQMRLEELAGKYFLYKLDSKRQRINQYSLSLLANGSVEYSLDVRDEDGDMYTHTYSGRVDIVHDSLIMTITRKDNKAYRAMFLFYVAGAVMWDIRQIFGSYSGLSTSDSCPLAGRCILTKRLNGSKSIGQIDVRKGEYFTISEANQHMFELISGSEDNLIKASKAINEVERSLDYGDIFFQYAINKQLTDAERADFLSKAFEHGFKKIDELLTELEPNGKISQLQNVIHVEYPLVTTVSYKTFRVISTHPRAKWEFEGREYLS